MSAECGSSGRACRVAGRWWQGPRARRNRAVEAVSQGASADFVLVGRRADLIRFLTEYGLEEEEVQGQIATCTPPDADGAPGPQEYLVHESLLHSHGEFPCAGDSKALSFCRQIADEMVARFGITPGEAVARINRHWPQPSAGEDSARIWIVGLDIAYHETPKFWAHGIYYGNDSHWWAPGSKPIPLSPP